MPIYIVQLQHKERCRANKFLSTSQIALNVLLKLKDNNIYFIYCLFTVYDYDSNHMIAWDVYFQQNST